MRLFLETNGAKECPEPIIACNAAETSAHEIGHLLNANHGDGGIMDDGSLNFAPPSLIRIRRILHP